MARLAALVPPGAHAPDALPRRVCPHSKLRAAVTPAPRLKRVFDIEIESCVRCGGQLRILASIEEQAVIARILAHLQGIVPERFPPPLPLGAQASPLQPSLL